MQVLDNKRTVQETDVFQYHLKNMLSKSLVIKAMVVLDLL